MTRKAIIAAAICGVAGLVMLLLYMERFEQEASGGPPQQILVAQRDIPLGAAITQDMLGYRALPQSYVEDRHIPASDAQRILGVRVTSGVRGGESLLWTDLATTSEQRRDLSALVRNGMRAITIRADVSASFGGLLRAGDRVDALLTAERDNREHITIPLLQNLLVLASGRDTGAPVRPGERTTTTQGTINQVTLSVTLEQAVDGHRPRRERARDDHGRHHRAHPPRANPAPATPTRSTEGADPCRVKRRYSLARSPSCCS